MSEFESVGLPTPEQSPDTEFIHPYLRVVQEEFGENFPENKAAMEAVIQAINEQTEANYQTFQSQRFPGVEVPYTTIKVTPELIQAVTGELPTSTPLPDETISGVKEEYAFLFAGQTLPKDGHALTTMDIALNEVIRALPRVANPLKKGETPPDISVVMLGLPNGLGGHVTRDFFNAVDRRGFDPFGELDAEIIESVTNVADKTPEEIATMDVMFRGVSKGAIIADRTLDNLPPELQERTQTHLYNPAGSHEPGDVVKGAQVLGGLVGEIAVRTAGDDYTKALMKHGAAFGAELQKRFQISKDDWGQQALKYATFASESLRLLKGSPLDTESHRHHIVENLRDPLTSGISRVRNVRDRLRERSQRFADRGVEPTGPTIAEDRDRSIAFAADNGTHFYTYNSPERYNTIFTTIKAQHSSPAPVSEAA